MNKFLPTLFLILLGLFSFAQEDTICVNSTTQFTPSGNPALTNPWISSDVNIATIDNNGLATGLSAGACIITFTDEFNVTTNFNLVVENPLNTVPILISAIGTDSQSLDFDTQIGSDYYYQPITDIVYQVGAGASISLSSTSQLPLGVTATVVGNTLTISGTPYTDNPITNPVTFNYTVIGSGINSCTNPSDGFPNSSSNTANGSITLNVPCVNTISQGYFISSICPGEQYNFYLTIGGNASGVTVNGGLNINAIGNQVTITGIANTYTGESFTVTTSGGNCIQSSTIVTYNVGIQQAGVNSTSNLNQTICLGQAIEDIVFNGGEFLSWDNSNFPAGIQNSTIGGMQINQVTFFGTPTEIGTFNYTIGANDHCYMYTASMSGTITVLPAPTPPTISSDNSSILCSNQSINLTSSSAISYLWSNGETSQSINVTSSGDYTVTSSDGTCTSTSQIFTITQGVSQTPSITITSNQSGSICSDQSVTFDANTVNQGTNPNFQWSINGISIGTNSPSFTTSGLIDNDIINCVVTNDFECPENAMSNNIVISNVVQAPVISFGSASETTSCGGSDGKIQINGTGTGTMYWSGAENGSQSVILPIMLLDFSVGNYELYFDNGNGCPSNIVSAIINEPALPEAPIISVDGNSTICEGESVILQSSLTSGNVWSTGETSQAISVNSAGIYSVTVTGAVNCTATSNEIEIFVNPTPITPTITASGSITFCEGGNVSLTSSAASGNTWTGGETDQTILVSASGSYVVNVTENGCTSLNSAPITVTVNPLPPAPSISASGPITFCEGQNVTLTSDITSGITWLPGGETSASITVNTAGSYYVTNTLNGCETNSAVISTIVNSTPNPVFTFITDLCDTSNMITFNQGNPIGGTYLLDGNVVTFFEPSQQNVGSHILEYTITSTENCTGTVATTFKVLNCSGVGLDETNLAVQLFPNPTNGIIAITGIDKSEITSIKVYDQIGKLIFVVENNNQVDLSNYVNGMYNLVITGATFESMQKVQLIK